MDLNRVVLVGRLTRDAELKYSQGGATICEFSIAVNSRRKQGDEWIDEPNFIDVTLFGRQAEAVNQYLTKGQQVGIDGRLKQDRWQDKEGQKRSKVAVIAENVALLGGKRDASGPREPKAEAMTPDSPRAEYLRGQAEIPDSDGLGFHDDIPF